MNLLISIKVESLALKLFQSKKNELLIKLDKNFSTIHKVTIKYSELTNSNYTLITPPSKPNAAGDALSQN